MKIKGEMGRLIIVTTQRWVFMKTMVQGHRRALKNGDVGSSALAEHVFSANHQVDLSKAMVIDTHNHTQTRCMLESWHIQHHQTPSTGRRAPCQDSMLHYCPDRVSIWPNPIFVLLLLLIFPFLPLFSFIFIYVLLITLY